MKKILFMGLVIGFAAILSGAGDQENNDTVKSNVTWAAAKTAGYGIGAYSSFSAMVSLCDRFINKGYEKVAGRSFSSKTDLAVFCDYVKTNPIEHQLRKDICKMIRYRLPVVIGGFIIGIGAAGYCAFQAWDSSLDLISSLKKL